METFLKGRRSYEIAKSDHQSLGHARKRCSTSGPGTRTEERTIPGGNPSASVCDSHRAWRNSRLRPERLAGGETRAQETVKKRMAQTPQRFRKKMRATTESQLRFSQG